MRGIKKFFKRLKCFNKKHTIEEGWLVQDIRFRSCIRCGIFEVVDATLDCRNYKILTKDNSIYFDGKLLEQ